MATGELWLVAAAVVCGLAAVALIVTLVVWRRRLKALRVALAVLLLITAAVSAGSAAAGLGSRPFKLPNNANRDAPDAAGLTVYAVTNTKATADTVVALDARTGAVRWSKVFAGSVVYIRARGPMDVIVEASKVGLAGSDVLALRASDGSTLWRRALQGGDMSGGRGVPPAILRLSADGSTASPLYTFTSQPSTLTQMFITQCTALRASDGAVLWQDTAPVSLPGMYSLPVITPSVVLFEASLFLQDGVTGEMEMRVVDAQTGQTRWVTRVQQGAISAERDAVVDKRAAYVTTVDPASQRQMVEALRLSDGHALWRVETEPASGMVGLIGVGGVLVATQTAMVALDIATGKTLWTQNGATVVGEGGKLEAELVAPVTLDHVVYFMARFGSPTSLYLPVIYAVDATTGALRWTHHLNANVSTTNLTLQTMDAAQGALVYVTGSDSGITALDAATGSVRWQAPGPGSPQLEDLSDLDLTTAPNTLYLTALVNTPPRPWHFCEGGVVYPFVWALSRSDGSVYWRMPVGEGHGYGSPECA